MTTYLRPDVFVLILFILCTPPLAAADPLEVGIFPGELVSPAMIGAALGTASFILQQADVRVEWRLCVPPSPPPACAARRGLVIRLLSEQVVPAWPHPLGDALLEPAGGRFATIYVTRIVALANAAGVDPAIVLGRVMAHELGHLLMGRRSHSPRGVMRALWTRADLERGRPLDWLFDPSDVVILRLRLRAMELWLAESTAL